MFAATITNTEISTQSTRSKHFMFSSLCALRLCGAFLSYLAWRTAGWVTVCSGRLAHSVTFWLYRV